MTLGLAMLTIWAEAKDKQKKWGEEVGEKIQEKKG